MAAKPTVAEVAEHIEHDKGSDAIERLIDSAEEEVLTRYGPHNAQVDFLRGGDMFLYTLRPVSLVTSIIETVGETTTSLAANDWTSRSGGWILERDQNGTNSRRTWADFVEVTYTPESDDDRRKMVIVELVRVSMMYNAAKSKRTGDVSFTFVEYQDERESILSTLDTRQRLFA